MYNIYREYLMETFGIEDEKVAVMNPDIKLQHPDDDHPFGEIVTTSSGRTILRVGGTSSKGPVLKIR